MVKNIFFAEEFVGQRHHEQSIRRVMSVNCVKAMFERHVTAHDKTGTRKINIFAKVTDHRLDLQPLPLEPAGMLRRGFLKELKAWHR